MKKYFFVVFHLRQHMEDNRAKIFAFLNFPDACVTLL